MIVTLTGEPRSTNHVYKSVCRGSFPSVYLSAEGKALKEAYKWEAKAQWKGKPLGDEVELWVTLYFGTKRRADLDNFNKLLLDSMTGVVYEDDSQIRHLHIERAYDPKKPRIEIEIV